MRITIATLVGLAVFTALCARLARALAEGVHDDVPTALDDVDELTDVRSCASPSHGYLPTETDVLSGRIV
jgi:hypothetical protein